MPAVTVIIVSHNKPDFVREAVQSVLDQTLTDWQGFLVDSGVLFHQGFFDDLNDPRLKVMPSGETPEMARSVNMASWCFNKVLNSGEVQGELIVYLCDDDIFYPRAFEALWNYYVDHNRHPQAMYGSEYAGVVLDSGETLITSHRTADYPAGKFCKGKTLDCVVDYLQFCHSAKVLEKYRETYKTDKYHREDRREASHCDGIFMEEIGALTIVHPVHEVIGVNRRTLNSVNSSSSDAPLFEAPRKWERTFWVTLREKLRRFQKLKLALHHMRQFFVDFR
jgi:spore maturation protein CgeD